MSALSPDDPVFLPGLMTTICFEQEDQRQAPVAAEKQRSVTHWCAYPDAGVRSDRMRQLLSGAIPCADSIDDGDHVNEMAIQCCRRDASTVLCARRKRKRNDFWELRSPGGNESAGPNPDHDPVAQTLRNVRKISPRKISAHVGVPRISTLFRPSCAERFSFQSLILSPAGIRP